MPIEKFSQIIEKLALEKTRKIGLYNWTEPFLNRKLEDYILIVKKHGILCDLSSTLSLRKIPNLTACLDAGVDSITISNSGTTQEIYEKNHVGGVLEYVMNHMETISRHIKEKPLTTSVTFRFIKFNHNIHQLDQAKLLADRLGFLFEQIEGFGNINHDLSFMSDDWYRKEAITGKPVAVEDRKICGLMVGQSTIDSSGDVYLCCAVPSTPYFKIGAHLDLSEPEILQKKLAHPYCRVCTFPRRHPSQREMERVQFSQINNAVCEIK